MFIERGGSFLDTLIGTHYVECEQEQILHHMLGASVILLNSKYNLTLIRKVLSRSYQF